MNQAVHLQYNLPMQLQELSGKLTHNASLNASLCAGIAVFGCFFDLQSILKLIFKSLGMTFLFPIASLIRDFSEQG